MNSEEVFTIKELVFLAFGLIGIGLYRLLGWIMPRTYNIFFEHIKKILTSDVLQKLEFLEKKVADNHIVKNELKMVLRAVLDNDSEALEAIREFYAKKEK